MTKDTIISLVRPLVTLVAVAGLTAGFFLGKVTADAYVPLMAMAITYWYKSRDSEKQNGASH